MLHEIMITETTMRPTYEESKRNNDLPNLILIQNQIPLTTRVLHHIHQ
jgi:hypothetical protein